MEPEDDDYYDDGEDEAALLAELEDLDLDEDQIDEALAMIESRPNTRTWKQNKDMKRAARQDREYFGRPRSGVPPPPQPRAGQGE
eukprot:8902408-Pyramimonas_sp.AAC.1